jgi:hypothetical protein
MAMPDDTNPFAGADVLVAARERLNIGPVPGWVIPCPFNFDYKAKETSPVTYLFYGRQIHAEQKQIHHHWAMRLETLQAVQHQSQWQFQFEPQTQSLTLHWIKIRRGNQAYDHTSLDKIRLLQREVGPERFVVRGWCTLLLLLEDVRPGDIIESCYTIGSRPLLLPEHCAAFFVLPPGAPVGRFHFALKFDESRPMKWKSGAADLTPVETRDKGERFWVWSGENCEEPGWEPNTPDWYIAGPWVQISDCPDWGTVARAVSEAWKEEDVDPILAEIAKEITGREPDISGQVEKAIELVQDEYRHFVVDVEPASQVPTSPGTVARKRYGDGKDLSFLLVQLLRQLGVAARPILVNTRLRKSLAELLPMDGLFNHVVVEYKVQDETRWVDAMMQQQGGGALNRSIPDYGAGLPVDPASSRLIESPRAPFQTSQYLLKETILLDTTGTQSLISAVLHAKGSHAEALRQQFGKSALEQVAEERQKFYAERFVNARRIGSLEFRDDRAANEFVLAEVFAIGDFLSDHPKRGMCRFRLSNHLLVQALQLPGESARRAPFLLPYPCNIVHTVVVEAPTLQPLGIRRRNLETSFVKFSRSHKCLHRFWSMTVTLSTLADAVPPDRIEEHCAAVEEIRENSLWEITLPTGYPHPVKRLDFGSLPPPPRKLTSHAAGPSPQTKPMPPASVPRANGPAAVAPNHPAQQPAKHRRRRHHSDQRRNQKKLWLVVAILFWILIVFILLIKLR